MKLKRIFILLLCLLMLMSVFAGCAGKKETNIKEPTSQKTTDTTSSEQPEEAEPTVDPEEVARQQKEACENALKEIKVELLAKEVLDYDDAHINGYFVYSEDYEKGTILTIGVSFPTGVYYNHFEGLTITGETATGTDGKPAVQTKYNTAWIDDNKTYAVMIVRIGGEVDPAKINIQIEGKTDGAVIDLELENEGATVGFENAIAAFAYKNDDFGCSSSIVKLKGRHYLIVRRYTSSSGWSGSTDNDHDVSTETKSYVLIPLERGFDRTLTKDDVKLVVNGTVENTTAQLLVNESGRIDASQLETQTTIEVEVTRTVVEPEDAEGNYSDEVYDKIDEDQKAMFEKVILEIDDGEGNIVTLRMN